MSKLQRTPHADTSELLSTKLAPPRLRSALVPREPLLTRLDEGLAHKLTLLSAPAGFGKTTLVAAWVAGYRLKVVSLEDNVRLSNLQFSNLQPSTRFAWVALDAGDNDPVRFWRYVITACQTFQPIVGTSALALLRTSQQPPWETMLTTFINELAQLSSRGILVLEDYHDITSRQIHETVAFLLDHLPATLHLIIITPE